MKFNGRGVYVSPTARIHPSVRIGDHSTIYDNVEIGEHSVICNDVILGEPTGSYYHDPAYENSPTIIGPDSFIRSHSIIYAGCTIGRAFSCGHRVTIRENTLIKDHCSVGTMTAIEGCVQIGNYSRLHSSVHIAQTCTVGDFVWMYPYSVMTNDPYPPSNDISGGHIGNYTQVAVHAVILPGVRVGENCLIGANSVVGRRIPDFSLATGDPAKVVMDIRKYVVLGKGKLYPWMNRFDRGMPWEGIGYESWMRQVKVDK
jgi:acetyltransferase-like isoleucine patch superfamily enzyme